jgi:hypothetical protein
MAQAELKAFAKLDGKDFEAGIKRVSSATDTFASKLGGMKRLIAGAFTIGAITAFSRKMLTMADDLQTAANTVGITMESMLGLKSAMAESGIGAESMLRIMGKLKNAQGEVIEGNKTFVDALVALNISQKEFVSLGVDDLMEVLARAYADSGESAEAFSAISAIYGERIGPQLIEVFQRLNKEGLQKFKEDAAGAADGMSELAAASDALEKLWDKLTIAAANFVGYLNMVKDVAIAAGNAVRSFAGSDAKFSERWAGVKKAVVDAVAKPTSTEIERPRQQAQASQQSAINVAALERNQAAGAQKLADQQARIDARADKERQKRQDIWDAASARRQDLLAGGGAVPEMARVGSLQRMGGIVGGVAGAGDQAARIAERQLKVNEEIEKIMGDALAKLSKLDDIKNAVDNLGAE